jgi:hypothetical protein
MSGRRLLWLGATGGAGTSTIRECLGFGEEADHWPAFDRGPLVVICARTSAGSLMAAHRIAIERASTGQLAGLVVVADSRGKLPKPLDDLARLVAGGFSDSWRVPWVEAWRLGAQPDLRTAPAVVRRMGDELRFAASEHSNVKNNERLEYDRHYVRA